VTSVDRRRGRPFRFRRRAKPDAVLSAVRSHSASHRAGAGDDRTTHAQDEQPYGRGPAELAEVLGFKQTVEPALRRAADLEIDTSIPLDEVVAKILDRVLRSTP